MTVNIQKALDTPGWMSEHELTWLAEQAQSHREIVEVGVWLGRSVRAVADHTSGRVIAFDWFKGHTGDVEVENQLEEFEKNLADHIASGKVVIKVGKHSDFTNGSREIYDGIPDMVFIDGDHEYSHVVHDIREWKGRLGQHGLLCGHDFAIPDVGRAVKEVLGTCVCLAPKTMIWYWTKTRRI